MSVLFLAVILINCVFLMYSYTYQINGINRTIVATPRAIFETAIPLNVEDEEVTLYYDQDFLKEEYESYLDRELLKYTDSYEVEYYFYNTSNGGFCDVSNCQGVEIKIEAKVMFSLTYKRTMKYEIKEGKN